MSWIPCSGIGGPDTLGNAIIYRMSEREYVLGTHDEEIDRLGMQHRVWRNRMTACWQRAGFGVGQKLIDAGAGPGYATLDLAQIVEDKGCVLALELSERFVEWGKSVLQANAVQNVDYRVHDLVNDQLTESGFDGAWCRWVLSFVSDPAGVIANVSEALRPGGRFAIHEYVDYSTWQYLSPKPEQAAFNELTMRNWRSAGGEPNIGFALPDMLVKAGMKVVHAEPVFFSIRPCDYAWQWPKRWIEGSSKKLVESGILTQDKADALLDELKEAEADANTIMLSPSVIELVAVKT